MDLPKPPDDIDLKNIIDKLANFVARNGPEFEQMTKTKQKGNPKFGFLYGGENFNYYQYRVTTEQAIINQQKQKLVQQQMTQASMNPQSIAMAPASVSWQQNAGAIPQSLQSGQTQVTIPTSSQVQLQQMREQVEQLRKSTQEQIKQSEGNLAAHNQSLNHQRKVQIDEAIALAQEDEIQNLSSSCEVSVAEFDQILQPIMDSCTKDAISNGKNWIFAHYHSDSHAKLISLYLKKRITAKVASFEMKLYLIYLINDLLHHCTRKNAEDLKKSLESVMIPIFCHAHAGADEEKQQKLVKLLDLWDRNKYFDPSVISELRQPLQAMNNYHTKIAGDYPAVVTQITSAVNARFSSLQQQHHEFVNHLNLQVQNQEQQLAQTLAQQVTTEAIQGQPPPTTGAPHMPPGFPPPNFNQPPPNFNQPPPGFAATPSTKYEYGHGQGPPVVQEYNHGQATVSSPGSVSSAITVLTTATVSAPQASAPPIELPDFSKPPPGFPAIPGNAPSPGMPPASLPGPPPGPLPSAQPPVLISGLPPVSEADLMPSVPYFELPAGLMAPLVKLEDCSYRPLGPELIRLPPPMPPNERLLAAVEAFYSPPSHDRPRDSEGWERLGLFEFFKAKEKAKKLKEMESQNKPNSKSRSSSRSRSRSRSRSPRRVRTYGRRSRSKSKSRSRSRSRSRSGSKSRSRSRSRSRSDSKSGSRSRSKSRSKTRSRSKSPVICRARSLSPESGYPKPFFATNTDTRLGTENKGHMLLKKMGWGGGGLGSSEQGIVDPVQHGEVRERVDMFKGIGVGVNNDPFEQFRKNKSQGFIQRMKERDPSSK